MNNAGAIDFGFSGGALGVLTINGDFQQTGSGTLKLRLQQVQNQQYDRLVVNGTANLGGTLLVTGFGNFNPAAQDQFNILTYQQEVGDFNNPYTLPGLTAPRTWVTASPGATSLTLVVQ